MARGFHLELTNICTLKCPMCSRTIFKDMFPSKWKNHSINLNDLKKFIDIDINGLRFQLCGTYGDPIYYDHLFELCRWIKSNGGHIIISTNGSYKPAEWWTELSTILDEKDEIIWAIDGIPDNFTTYRVNSDWKSIKLGIDIITKTKIKTNWQFIIFQYNENFVDQAHELSKQYNMTTFSLVNNDRFTTNPDLKRSTKFDNIDSIDSASKLRYEKTHNWQNNAIKVDPHCLKTDSEHYITADGHYVSCSFLSDHSFYYKSYWGKNKSKLKISDTSFSKLMEDSSVKDYFRKLAKNDCEAGCRFICPKVS